MSTNPATSGVVEVHAVVTCFYESWEIDALRLTVNDVSPEILSETIYSHSLQGEGGLEDKVES